jgi:hypothetical protein
MQTWKEVVDKYTFSIQHQGVGIYGRGYIISAAPKEHRAEE